MACHYTTYGHTKPIVGAYYAQSLRYRAFGYRLRSFNPVTEIATLEGRHGPQYIPLSALSRWHLVAHS